MIKKTNDIKWSELDFRSEYVAGNILLEDIDKYIEYWHESEEDLGKLHNYLGLSESEYTVFVTEGELALKNLIDKINPHS